MIEIKVTFKGLQKLKDAPKVLPKILQQLSEGTAEVYMKQIAPYKTSRLKGSIDTEIKGLKARVGPHTEYAAAQEYGMPASPGRYVPAIGKRLKFVTWRADFGTWPGFKGKRYVERTYDEVRRRAPQITRKVIKEHFNK